MLTSRAPLAETAAPVVRRACDCGGRCAGCAPKDRFGAGPVLRLGPADDVFERQADRMADEVMASEGPLSAPEGLQRQSEGEDEEDELQLKAAPDGARAPGGVAAAAAAVSSGGRPLPRAERAFFEPRFGRDLSHVRIHTDAQADRAARGIGARAYALGDHIAFAAGRFRPGDAASRRLTAHELAHTLQQAADGPRRTAWIRRDCADDQRRCRNAMNWSDGGHWIGTGPEPDCNCDNSLEDARGQCSNRMNWSDGGYWIGTGPEPDCSLSETVTRNFTLIYAFPSNECVQKFYAGRSQIATRVSTGAGVAVGTLAFLASRSPAIADSAAATTTVGVAGIILGAATNEAIGALPQSLIGVGYQWERRYSLRYTRSAHPWGVNSAGWTMESEITDETGDLVQGMSASGEFSEQQLQSIGRLMPMLQSSTVRVNCPDANVLSM